MPGYTSSQSIETRDLELGKEIFVCKNGDPLFLKRFVMNKRNCPNTPTFMNRMTELGKLTNACQIVYDVTGRVIAHTNEIQAGGRYIIGEDKRFRRLG